jgi:hypothetical protein
MDKGIRPATNAKFAAMLPTRVNTTAGNCAFRKGIMYSIMEDFGITLASAATHYNHSFQAVKAANPELVEGLGRADDKKGGRKPKVVATPAVIVPAPMLLLGYTPAVASDVSDAGETAAEQTLFTVKKKGDDTVIRTFSFDDATALVAKAAAAKKAKLYFV